MKSWYKKITAEEVLLFYTIRELTAEETAKGITLNEYGNVPTGCDFIDKFAALIRSLQWATLKEYAETMGVTANELTTTIRILTGQTAKYWIEYYMQLAIYDLMGNTTNNIITVAKKLGFSQPSVLSHFCLYRLKIAPTELRRKLKKRK